MFELPLVIFVYIYLFIKNIGVKKCHVQNLCGGPRKQEKREKNQACGRERSKQCWFVLKNGYGFPTDDQDRVTLVLKLDEKLFVARNFATLLLILYIYIYILYR
jgi:hypothetical protein